MVDMNSKRGPDITLAPELKEQDSITHFDVASSLVNVGIGSRELNNTNDKIAYTGMGLALEAGSAPYSLYPREVKGMDVGGVLGDYIYLVANSRFLALSYEQKKDEKNRQFSEKCGTWSLLARCPHGHRFAKKLFCGREWCLECRDQTHNRRIARWLPKAQQLEAMGYWVITFPEEVLPLLRRPRVWAEVGRKTVRILRSEGFTRGLRRWHWFGDENTRFRPHLNVIVEGRYLRRGKLELVKKHLREGILPVGIRKALGDKEMVINYSYTKDPAKMYHILKYVTRPTFLERDWDNEMAARLWNFRNNAWWGRWTGEAKWQINSKESENMKAANSLGKGICPICGEKITWEKKPIDSTWLMIWGAKDLGDGYYELPPDETGGPSEVEELKK